MLLRRKARTVVLFDTRDDAYSDVFEQSKSRKILFRILSFCSGPTTLVFFLLLFLVLTFVPVVVFVLMCLRLDCDLSDMTYKTESDMT